MFKGGTMIVIYLKDTGHEYYELTASGGVFGYIFNNNIPKEAVEFEDGIEIVQDEVCKICIKAWKVIKTNNPLYPYVSSFDKAYDNSDYRIVQMVVSKVEEIPALNFEPISIRMPEPESITWTSETTEDVNYTDTSITWARVESTE